MKKTAENDKSVMVVLRMRVFCTYSTTKQSWTACAN